MTEAQTNPETEVDQEINSLLQLFEYDHLKPKLQEVSKHFHGLAWMVGAHRHSWDKFQVRQCLWQLLQAKDCAVRAAAKEVQQGG